MDIKEREVFEIKPANLRQVAAGLAQLLGYIILLNKLTPGGGWTPGEVGDYTPPSLLPVDGTVVVVLPPIAGVITYYPLTELVNDEANTAAKSQAAESDNALGEVGLTDVLAGF